MTQHNMIIAETMPDGLNRLVCTGCDLVVYAKPGYTKIVRFGDNSVAHSFITSNEPIPAPGIFTGGKT